MKVVFQPFFKAVIAIGTEYTKMTTRYLLLDYPKLLIQVSFVFLLLSILRLTCFVSHRLFYISPIGFSIFSKVYPYKSNFDNQRLLTKKMPVSFS